MQDIESQTIVSAGKEEESLVNPARYEIVLRSIVNRILNLLDAEHCSIALIDKKSGELVTRASSRVTAPGKLRQSRFKLRVGIAGHVAATKQSFLCGDVNRAGEYIRIGNDQIASLMCVPLLHKKQVLGTITVTSPRFDAFTSEHLQLLDEMADQEAVGIAKLIHSDASLRQSSRLASQLQLNQITANVTNRENLITRVLEWLETNFKQSESAFLLFGKRAKDNSFYGSALAAPLILHRSILAANINKIQCWLTENCQFLPEEYRNFVKSQSFSSIILIPVGQEDKDHNWGILAVFSKNHENKIAASELELLEELGEKLSDGLELAERHQQSQEMRSYLNLLTTSLSDPLVELDLEGRVQEWNDAAEALFGFSAQEITGQFIPSSGDIAKEKAFFEHVKQGVTLANVVMEKRHKDGSILSLSVTLAPIRDVNESIRGISLLVRDITENTRLKQEAARRNQEMTNLSEIALRLASTLDTSNLLFIIKDYLGKLIDYDALYVATFDETRSIFEIQLHVEHGVYYAPESWNSTEPILNWLLQHGRQLVIDASDNDFPLKRFRSLEGHLPNALLVTPTKLDEQVSGFIAIANYQNAPFKQYHKQLMVIVASQAAIALEKARILRRSQRKAEHLTILRQVAKVTSSSLELTEVLRNTFIELHRHIDFNWANIQVFGPDGLYRQLEHDFMSGNELPELKFGSIGLSHNEVAISLRNAVPITELDYKVPRFRRILESYNSRQLLSGVLMPLWYGERCTGLLQIGASQDYLYTEDDLILITDIINQAVGPIENALLHELVITQVEQLELQAARERKLLRQTAQERERLEAIFGNSSDGIILIDDKFNVLRLNSAIGSFIGAESEEPGKKCQEVLRCQDKEGNLLCEIACPLTKALVIKEPLLHHEIRLDNRKGLRRTVSANWSAVLSAEGTTNIVATMRDVTALREVEQLKTNFVSMVSHELRNPINVINGFTKMLAEGKAGELNQLQQEFISSILVSVNQLKKLAEDILDLSRSDAGRFSVNLVPISLTDIMLKAVNNIKPMIYAKNIRLITAQLPEETCVVHADEMRLTQLIGNLFENAIKFTPQGGRIMVELKLENDFSVISIADSGIGISPEHLSRIFERFYQVQDEEARRIRGSQLGSGLGLSICKEIVERHGGRIWVESIQGKGSTFSFSIPLA
ncbi:MAG: GAF domain-containing protein [Chloroflexi bacterium]|uniref:histidine kinase n=1 Tax=Candidatus Chlorohelix allophototropha TaxID=3003348 RepID=A0A8T7M804_9CHLR|nr:GAF domain-containing protein [Chloroflexota bacterium]WJW68081.1 GAF domain-containing protein [Chloroflexota bacterium L227-S17]